MAKADADIEHWIFVQHAITLSPDGAQFSVTATIQDFDANNNQLSTGCVTQTAKRL